ncbi:MAG: bifunctional demethylmenaquinone methyltransferase/2-methoxy-6-polyprenyl-1,4-benzoquinol methylase UbiE [Bacteroidales bacterium]|nr:bifunctional demethylmenaquinone methyltransferase/2-methoxy-6-polyprenyl-1,4-benzoquinol methylase UbiE [Bacteroidales bacterium]
MVPLKERSEPVISSMFNSISKRYDLLNHLLSFGFDTLWRKRMVRMVRERGAKEVLDIACGTGDLTIALWKEGMHVTGVDIAEKMVEIARGKNSGLDLSIREAPEYIISSASSLPFEQASFDAVTISFGIRNFEEREKALGEVKRVLKPSGLLAVMEFSAPENRVWNRIFGFYFKKILPYTGRIISGNSFAYSYLPESVSKFPKPEEFCRELKKSGFYDLTIRSMTGNIAVIYLSSCN